MDQQGLLSVLWGLGHICANRTTRNMTHMQILEREQGKFASNYLNTITRWITELSNSSGFKADIRERRQINPKGEQVKIIAR